MDGMEGEEEEDLVEKEEAISPAIIVERKDIWKETSNYLLKYIVTIVRLRTM